MVYNHESGDLYTTRMSRSMTHSMNDEATEADPEVVNPVVVEFSGVDRCQSWKPDLVRSESETKYYY